MYRYTSVATLRTQIQDTETNAKLSTISKLSIFDLGRISYYCLFVPLPFAFRY